MTKSRVVHYRPEGQNEPIVCSFRYKLRDVEWTHDPNDTTCNNCLKTLQWEEDMKKGIPV